VASCGILTTSVTGAFLAMIAGWHCERVPMLGGWVCAHVVGDSMSASRVDRLPCVGLDPLGHRCGAGCLPIVARTLPTVPGWRWRYGSVSCVGWSFWLERVGSGGGRWFVLDDPAAETARGLVAVIHAYAQGLAGVVIE
jgi:hypothetical protein